jgi:hypothetical protein
MCPTLELIAQAQRHKWLLRRRTADGTAGKWELPRHLWRSFLLKLWRKPTFPIEIFADACEKKRRHSTARPRTD